MVSLPSTFEPAGKVGHVYGPKCHSAGIRGYGNPDDGVVVVGIAPGRNEIEKTHRPFTGPSGDLLNAVLEFADWSRERVYCTNTICWWNNKPTITDREACMERFHRELTWLQPKVIVTAGEIAQEAVSGFKRRTGSRGAVVWSSRWNCYVLDTHHPSFALQANSMDAVQDMIRDFEKIPRILTWKHGIYGADPSLVDYSVVNTLEEAQDVLDNLPRRGYVSLDIETSNPDDEVIDAYSDALLCFAVSYDDPRTGAERTWVFPTRIWPTCVRDGTHARGTCGCPHVGGTFITWPRDVNWLFQFGQFDTMGLLAYFGELLPLMADTGLMSYCVDERTGKHKLKVLARENLAAGWYEADVKKFYKGKMNLLKPEAAEEYNAKDASYTKRLAPILWKQMHDAGTVGLYQNVLLPAMQTFIKMQAHGIYVDQPRLQELAYDEWFPTYLRTIKEMQAEAREIGWPTDDINFNSSKQLQKLFFQIMGEDPIKYSKKTGAPSLDKETLDQMDHPFAAQLRGLRTQDTMIDYVLAVMNNLKYDGLLHPSAFVTTTRTGRTSYRDPAMQTIPKDYTVGASYARLREIFTPRDPEHYLLLEYDYNQIEVWLAWAYSKDPVLLAHLESGDVHSATAELAFKTKRELHDPLKWQEMRQNAKKIRFGIQYGEGPEKLASPPPVGIGGTVADARIFITQYKAGYPVYTHWMEDIQRQALNEGFLRSPSGRVMRFPWVSDHKQLRQAINFPIQGTASDYNLLSMIELYPILLKLDAHIILNIHDCLVIECPKSRLQEVNGLVHEVMEKPKFPGFPSIKVEGKMGPNLGQMVKIK